MNKHKNVCLGRRGRPKKNQKKLELSDFIYALKETDEFSFFPLDKDKIIMNNCEISNHHTYFRLDDVFRGWQTDDLGSKFNEYETSASQSGEKLGEDDSNNSIIKVKLDCGESGKSNVEVDVSLNKGVYTKCKNIPYLMFANGHVWKMSFSPPTLIPNSNSFNEGNGCKSNMKVIYLSMGIHPLNNPLSQIDKRYCEKGIIQIWEIPCNADIEDAESSSTDLPLPILKYEISHNGLICRYMEWIPANNDNASNVDTNSQMAKFVGILFCILGDGNSYLLSVPYNFSLNPVQVNFDSLVIWKYSDVFTVISGSVCIPSPTDNSIKISATTAEGVMLIWTFERNSNENMASDEILVSNVCSPRYKLLSKHNIDASEQIITVSQNIPLLCSCWCPVSSSYLIAACNNNGTVFLIDYRRCNNHIIKEFELPNRPITSVSWCRLTNNLLISHGIGAIMLSIENGDYTQFTIEAFIKKKKYSIYDKFKYPILGSRSWTCDSLLHYAIFGFNDGSTVVGPCFEFESKSFHETLLIKTFVSSTLSGSENQKNEVNNGSNENELDLFNNMKRLVKENYNDRFGRMKLGTVNIHLNHCDVGDESSANMTDYLEVHCVKSIDPLIYPQLINQPFIAISYFGGLVAIYRLE